jgi:uncharacterized protein YjbJ (UPF0337 family)
VDTDTKLKLEGRWDEAKGRVREAWGSLTDDDVDRCEGRWDQLVGTIKQKTGETSEAVEEKLHDLVDKLDPR